MTSVYRRGALCALALFAAIACATGVAQSVALPSEQPLSFSNVRTTGGNDPHAYGVTIELFKHGGVWSGFMSEHTGSVADPPAGKLDSLQVDERNGTLTFTAKLTLGVTRKGNDWVPTRDVYKFSGRIDSKTVSGPLTHRADGDDARGESSENVVLARESRDSEASSYERWLATWTRVMKARGPK